MIEELSKEWLKRIPRRNMNNSSLNSNRIIATLEGTLQPASGKIDQYEFDIPSVSYVNTKLPLVPGNPYTETASKTKGRKCKGKAVTCKFQNYAVTGQFHRSSKVGIWIGSNRTNDGKGATQNWHTFMTYFGIIVGVSDLTIPVYLDFYPHLVVIRLINGSVPKE